MPTIRGIHRDLAPAIQRIQRDLVPTIWGIHDDLGPLEDLAIKEGLAALAVRDWRQPLCELAAVWILKQMTGVGVIPA